MMEYVYALTHTYNKMPNRFTFVRSNLLKEDFEKLVAFIEFESDKIDQSYSVDQEEIAEVLCQLYGATLLPNGRYTDVIELDQYLNWEKYCSRASEIEKIKEFHRTDLNVMLEFYIDRYYGSYE